MNESKFNLKNNRVKRDYLIWLKEAKQRSPATVEEARHAIDRFEAYTGYKDFGTFNKEQAISFKKTLVATKARRSGKPLSITTVHHVLQAIKEFLAWLQGWPEYRRRIKPSDIAYLNLTAGEERQAHVTTPKRYATIEQYRAAIFAMPTSSETEYRDRAVVSFLLATGMRDAALVSLKLRHIDIERNHVFQDPRHVKTKQSKSIETFFYPVGDDVITIIHEWVRFLTGKKLYGPDHPLFPKTMVGPDVNGGFAAQGLGKEHWANATPVRLIFKAAFERVGLPYVNPHTIRNTLTQFAYKLKLDPEQFKAWSQNMGHDKPLTTLNSYGSVSPERQAEIIGSLNYKQPDVIPHDDVVDRIAEKIAAKLKGLETLA